MNFPLPSDISQRLQACMARGSHQSEEEVLRDALDALEQREQQKLASWHAGNAIAMDQSRHGLSQPLDDDAVVERLRQRLAAAGIT